MRQYLAILVCGLMISVVQAGGDINDEAMIDLSWDSGCFNCHDLERSLRGPAWLDVAARYRDDEEAFERLVETVREGGSGNWGDERMTPSRRVPMEDIRTLVGWILSLEQE